MTERDDVKRTEITTDPDELVPGPHGNEGSADGGTTGDGAVAQKTTDDEPRTSQSE